MGRLAEEHESRDPPVGQPETTAPKAPWWRGNGDPRNANPTPARPDSPSGNLVWRSCPLLNPTSRSSSHTLARALGTRPAYRAAQLSPPISWAHTAGHGDCRSQAARARPRAPVAGLYLFGVRCCTSIALRAAGRHVEKYISHPFNSAGAARQPAARGPSGTASGSTSLLRLGLFLLALGPLPLRLRFGLLGATSVHVVLGLLLLGLRTCAGGAGQRGSSRVALADAHTQRGVPGSSTPAVPPLTARFAAFSNDFCFSCSLYAARDKEGESVTGC